MRPTLLPAALTLALLPLLPLAAAGQTTTPADTAAVTCPEGLTGPTERVCTAALDGVRVLFPTAGLLMGGGNPVLGTAGAAAGGKFGRFDITIRGTVAQVVLPDPRYDGVADTVNARARGTRAAPRVDAAFGLLSKPLTMGTVAVDLLGSVLFIPREGTSSIRPVAASREAVGYALGFGWGFRAAMIPATAGPIASLSVTKRDAPTITYGGPIDSTNATWTFSTSAINVRLLGGKRFGRFEFAGGAGADLMSGKATLQYRNPESGALQPELDTPLSATRLIFLINGGWHVGPTRISGEAGYQMGSAVEYQTRFHLNNTSSGKFFGGVGLSFSL